MAALVGIAANLRAVLAAHVALQLVDRRRLRPANNVKRYRLVGVAAEAADLKIEISCVQSVAEARRGLSRSGASQRSRERTGTLFLRMTLLHMICSVRRRSHDGERHHA
jgi:hypothetical protein